MLARSCLLVTRELLNTAQDDGGNSVFIQTRRHASMPRGKPDIVPRNADEG